MKDFEDLCIHHIYFDPFIRFKEHKKTVHEGEINQCDECDYIGRDKFTLKEHKESKHLEVSRYIK